MVRDKVHQHVGGHEGGAEGYQQGEDSCETLDDGFCRPGIELGGVRCRGVRPARKVGERERQEEDPERPCGVAGGDLAPGERFAVMSVAGVLGRAVEADQIVARDPSQVRVLEDRLRPCSSDAVDAKLRNALCRISRIGYVTSTPPISRRRVPPLLRNTGFSYCWPANETILLAEILVLPASGFHTLATPSRSAATSGARVGAGQRDRYEKP